MRTRILLFVLLSLGALGTTSLRAFEGTITASLARGGQATPLLYTVGTNALRVEVTAADRPYPVDILDRPSGALTLLFPGNRSFVRLKPVAENQSTAPPGFPGMPMPPGGLPPGIGAQVGTTPGSPASPMSGMSSMPAPPPPATIGVANPPGMSAVPQMPQMPQRPQMPQMPQMPQSPGAPAMPSGIGPQAGAGVAGMPAMPMMPPMAMKPMELTRTTDTTNLLGYLCTRYEIRGRGDVMEIWATDKLLPFQPYLRNQRYRFGPKLMEEQWGELLKAKRLFPLLAVLRFQMPPAPGHTAPPPEPERLRFEVKSITPEKISDDTLFQPPPGYHEIQPLPF